MTQPTERLVQANGIRLHVAELGSGPAVLLCHGWPESHYSWRHQMTALAAAGYRAIAPDMRGYGDSDSPADPAAFTLLHLVGDMVGLLDALGIETAVVVGHDWGAPVAWNGTLMRPDRFTAVAGLSVPYRPRSPSQADPVSIVEVMRRRGLDGFYMVHFQTPGVEAQFDRDPGEAMRRILYALSGDNEAGWRGMVGPGGTLIETMPGPDRLPGWLTEADVAFYAARHRKSGFRGGLNWYRNLDRNNELLAPWAGAKVRVPALFIAGTRDPVLGIPGFKDAATRLPQSCSDLRGVHLIEGAGHWVQQERPSDVNAALLAFLGGL
ncbi:MAG TPA: alpha/beta hydrolase [Azospirillaceae bacterium]|nr:alpha/beta hydrolase [Azospirillaceae bacterium]